MLYDVACRNLGKQGVSVRILHRKLKATSDAERLRMNACGGQGPDCRVRSILPLWIWGTANRYPIGAMAGLEVGPFFCKDPKPPKVLNPRPPTESGAHQPGGRHGASGCCFAFLVG